MLVLCFEPRKKLGRPELLESGPLPACPAGEPVRWLEAIPRTLDPCRLARQVKQSNVPFAGELLHRPHVRPGSRSRGHEGADSVSWELLHRPDKPAGVGPQVSFAIVVVFGPLSAGSHGKKETERCRARQLPTMRFAPSWVEFSRSLPACLAEPDPGNVSSHQYINRDFDTGRNGVTGPGAPERSGSDWRDGRPGAACSLARYGHGRRGWPRRSGVFPQSPRHRGTVRTLPVLRRDRTGRHGGRPPWSRRGPGARAGAQGAARIAPGKARVHPCFVEEAQIAGQLQHPGVVPVYELGTFPDLRPFFTMKLVRGETLNDMLRAEHRRRTTCRGSFRWHRPKSPVPNLTLCAIKLRDFGALNPRAASDL